MFLITLTSPTEFAYGKVDPHEAGQEGGKTGGSAGGSASGSGGQYKPTENDGLKKDGTPDQRVGTGGTISISQFELGYRC